MSTGRRYTAGELDLAAINAAIARHPFNPHEKSADATRRTVLSLMFKDGYRECEKQTESQVAGLVELVEKAYREGFRDGMVDYVAEDHGIGGIGEDAYWSISVAREALSKFIGEA